MSREIKFRVWTGGGMEYNVTTGKFGTFYVNPEAKGDGLNPKDTASLTPGTTKYSDTTPVMQFTGLKNHAGVEIYEGDILTDGSNKAVVMWSEGDLGYYLNDIDERNFGNLEEPAHIIDDSKGWIALGVIGNVHENPELLKEQS